MMGPPYSRFSFERTEDFKKVEDVMEKMNISHSADQYVTNLSGGMEMQFYCESVSTRTFNLIVRSPISQL